MENASLSISFSDSLKEDVVSCVSEFAEIGLDAIMNDGILKDVPIVSTAVSLYKIGNSFKERHNIKKLIVFLNEFNNGIENPKKRRAYREKFSANDSFRNQQIEYLLVLIDRYISYDKPLMLAKLYLAYLDDLIDWNAFSSYAEIIDSFLPGDRERLIEEGPFVTHYNQIDSSILRLSSSGLLIQTNDSSLTVDDGRGGFMVTSSSMEKARTKEKIFDKTEFGHILSVILKDD